MKRSTSVTLAAMAILSVGGASAFAAYDNSFPIGVEQTVNVTDFSNYSYDPPGPDGTAGIDDEFSPRRTDNQWEQINGGVFVLSNPSLLQLMSENVAPLGMELVVPNGQYSVGVHFFHHGAGDTLNADFTFEGTPLPLVDDTAQGIKTVNLGNFTVLDGVLNVIAGDASSSASGNWFHYDNLAITRTSAVPEPASLASLALGGAATLLMRRRSLVA